MWICSQLGFFSIVHKDDAWHVRARLKADLERLLQAAELDDLEVQRWPRADYRWRVLANAEKVHAIFMALERSVDYPNFKSRIAGLPGQRQKLDAYHDLWHALYRLQDQ